MSESRWIDALAAEDLPDNDVWPVQVQGLDIAVYGVEGEVYATANQCTHGNARLCDGFLEGHEIECPLHQGRFDVRDGRPTCEPAAEPLRCYPVKIEAGRVFVRID